MAAFRKLFEKSPSNSVRKCTRCGQTEIIDPKGPKPGRTQDRAKNVGRCENCGIFICGSCAMKALDLYVAEPDQDARPPDVIHRRVRPELVERGARQNARTASIIAAIKMVQGEGVDNVIDETNDATEGTLLVTYKCPRCGRELVF
jgi:DNA-directed RNA polymerase subunit RPC12/RpoP